MGVEVTHSSSSLGPPNAYHSHAFATDLPSKISIFTRGAAAFWNIQQMAAKSRGGRGVSIIKVYACVYIVSKLSAQRRAKEER